MTHRDMRKPAQRQGEASVGGLQNADSLEHLHGKVCVCVRARVCNGLCMYLWVVSSPVPASLP